MNKMSQWYDFFAGSLYLFLAVFIYFNPPEFFKDGKLSLMYGLMALLCVYGLFRLYRGFKAISKK